MQTIIKDDLNLGFIGAGQHALQAHALPARKIEGLKIGAVFDVSAESLDRFERELGQAVFRCTSEEHLLASDVDAVLIATPDQFHAESLDRAIKAKKHVFIEKPLATNHEELALVKEALNSAEAQGLLVSSCHPRRFDPPFVKLKEMLPELIEKFGIPLSFIFDFSYHRPFQAWKTERSLLLDHANHEIDLLHFLHGYSSFEAERVADSFDHYAVRGLREDGLSFSFSGSRRLAGRSYDEWLQIRFERGDILVDSGIGEMIVHDHELRTRERFDWPKTNYEYRFLETTRNFVEAVRDGGANYLTKVDLLVNTEFAVGLTEQQRFSWDCSRT